MSNINLLKKRLKELRKINSMTQQDLANKLGIVRTAITNYETGRTIPDSQTLSLIDDIFNTSTDYLLGRTDIVDIFYNNDITYKNLYSDKICEDIANFSCSDKKKLQSLINVAKNLTPEQVQLLSDFIRSLI